MFVVYPVRMDRMIFKIDWFLILLIDLTETETNAWIQSPTNKRSRNSVLKTKEWLFFFFPFVLLVKKQQKIQWMFRKERKGEKNNDSHQCWVNVFFSFVWDTTLLTCLVINQMTKSNLMNDDNNNNEETLIWSDRIWYRDDNDKTNKIQFYHYHPCLLFSLNFLIIIIIILDNFDHDDDDEKASERKRKWKTIPVCLLLLLDLINKLFFILFCLVVVQYFLFFFDFSSNRDWFRSIFFFFFCCQCLFSQ